MAPLRCARANPPAQGSVGLESRLLAPVRGCKLGYGPHGGHRAFLPYGRKYLLWATVGESARIRSVTSTAVNPPRKRQLVESVQDALNRHCRVRQPVRFRSALSGPLSNSSPLTFNVVPSSLVADGPSRLLPKALINLRASSRLMADRQAGPGRITPAG